MRCPDFMYTNRVFGTAKCVQFIKVSSLQESPEKEVSLHSSSIAILTALPHSGQLYFIPYSSIPIPDTSIQFHTTLSHSKHFYSHSRGLRFPASERGLHLMRS